MSNNKQKAYIEIRPAAGGDEAKIWATDLLRMYTKYASKMGWKTKPVDAQTVMIRGEKAFELLKNESGVHRVQRVPVTEKRGRIHTSTATVAVLPEIKASQVKINPADIDWQFFRASTQGGQNVQKVSTAVRLTHKPSGIVVTSEQERKQEQNRAIALELLRSKLWEKEQEKRREKQAKYRSAIGKGRRSEKIRTYNYPQNRVKDHRINKSWQQLDSIIDGDLDKVVGALQKKL
ncbi:MAG: peptide chain release factor-like protein [Candidatus Woesebacteria bacterium]|jgi:peptide chain release factor 1